MNLQKNLEREERFDWAYKQRKWSSAAAAAADVVVAAAAAVNKVILDIDYALNSFAVLHIVHIFLYWPSSFASLVHYTIDIHYT